MGGNVATPARAPGRRSLMSNVRVAAILGLDIPVRIASRFQKCCSGEWNFGPPDNTEDADAILVFGGDGTIHRHLARLVELQLPVLIVPLGSGNDFARALGLRSVNVALDAWKNFVSTRDNTRRIDLGRLASAVSERYFCCAAGIGLDGEIARRANLLPRWSRAAGGYALSLPSALLGFSSPVATIQSAEANSAQFNRQPITLAVFSNTKFYGGGMQVAPWARPDDGLLDLCLIPRMNKLRLIAYFPTIYSGKHLSVRGVSYCQSPHFLIETETPCDVYADGEYVCQTPINMSCVPSTLTVIVP